jgi:hypothetical protein
MLSADWAMIDTRLLAVAILGIEAGFAQNAREQILEPSPRVELEFIASDVSRSGTTIFKLWRGIHLEGEYLGSANFDVGITGVSWKFRWKGLALSPGFAVGFGSGAQTAPVVTLRWTLETRRWYSQGFFGQSLRGHIEANHDGESASAVHASVLDNNHFSVRLGPMEAGPLWEWIKYREEKEWKGGARIAARLGRRFKIMFITVGPGVEFRGGVAFEQ